MHQDRQRHGGRMVLLCELCAALRSTAPALPLAEMTVAEVAL
jgi:hypothetical protein